MHTCSCVYVFHEFHASFGTHWRHVSDEKQVFFWRNKSAAWINCYSRSKVQNTANIQCHVFWIITTDFNSLYFCLLVGLSVVLCTTWGYFAYMETTLSVKGCTIYALHAPMTQKVIFIVPRLLWHRASVSAVSLFVVLTISIWCWGPVCLWIRINSLT